MRSGGVWLRLSGVLRGFCRGWRWSRRSVGEVDELDVEDQIGLGRDGAFAAIFSVGELVRDVEATLAADAHAGEASVPAGDDAVGTVSEGDGFLAGVIEGGVELGAVGEPTGVLDGVELVRRGEGAGAADDIDIAEGVEGLGSGGDGRNAGRVVGFGGDRACSGLCSGGGRGVAGCSRWLVRCRLGGEGEGSKKEERRGSNHLGDSVWPPCRSGRLERWLSLRLR